MMRHLHAALMAAVVLAIPKAAQAEFLVYEAILVPEAVGATGTGFTTITLDTLANTMRVEAIFSGLSGLTTVSHIHAITGSPFTGNAGVATQVPTFIGFPVDVSAGLFDETYDMTLASSFNPAFITANGGTVDLARAALFSAIGSGQAYLNIHSTTFPTGEIRGYPTLVPEPSSFVLLGLGTLALLAASRGRATKRGT